MSTRFTKDEIASFTEKLRAQLPPGSSVYTSVLHVSRSGMSREIAAYVHTPTGIENISWQVAAITGQRYGERGGVIVGGCGMDMTFALVYGLSRRLYPEGHKCTGSDGYTATGRASKAGRCPSNDHVNDYGRLVARYDREHPDELALSTFHGLRGESERAYVHARQTWISEQKTYTKTRNHRDGGYAIGRVSL